MKKFLSILYLICMMVSFSTFASAVTIQFSPTATLGGMDTLTNINLFDWSPGGDLVIEQDLVASSTGATTLSSFFATAVNGDMLTMAIHAQARITKFEDPLNNEVTAPGLSTDGGLTGTYEVTGVLDAVETGTYFNGSLFFGPLSGGSISGTYAYYLDQSPDSVVSTGAGFADGDFTSPFLTGNILSQNDASFFSGAAQSGSAFLTNSITSYDSNIIDIWPTPADPTLQLIGTTFDTTINLQAGNANRVGTGGSIGGAGYTVLAADLVYKADASSLFEAGVVPEPGTILLLGFGLLGIAGIGRRKLKK